MRFTTLIDVDSLAANLRAPDWVVLDCRFELGKPSAGEATYVAGHIPGARYAHLDRDLRGGGGPVGDRPPLASTGGGSHLGYLRERERRVPVPADGARRDAVRGSVGADGSCRDRWRRRRVDRVRGWQSG